MFLIQDGPSLWLSIVGRKPMLLHLPSAPRSAQSQPSELNHSIRWKVNLLTLKIISHCAPQHTLIRRAA